MTDLLRAGFFSDLKHGEADGPSLRDSVTARPHADEDRIAAYLERGNVLAASGTMVYDVLQEHREPVAVLEMLTDGTWLWPSDLSYYVRTYHVRVPDELVSHAEAQGWEPPTLDRAALTEVEERLFEGSGDPP